MEKAPSSSAYDQAMHDAILNANAQYGVSIPESVFRQLIFSESSFNPAANIGGAYAGMGGLGAAAIKDVRGSGANVLSIQANPFENIKASADYLAKLVRDKGGLYPGLVAYKGYGGSESQLYAQQVLDNSGYGALADDSGGVVSQIFGSSPKAGDSGAASQAGGGTTTQWSTLQRYAASAAALVLGVGLLLVVTGKDTLNSLSRKAFT